ncbi:MAG TPA: Rieske 2Fe-2S domain-containing protein, partial [Gemmatimonadales bacterium]|nr:Rieske 2Fe-2S domain-containing protein [Gemmatimonadales bacterium]
MAEQPNTTGPDLGVGLPASSVQPGEKLLGHVSGEPVLLARLGDEYLAIGATCTHYGGPLAEGVLEGETVRCPWHHACFSLRSGEALRAPALSPLPCWQVERRGDQILVTRKIERDPLTPVSSSPSLSGRMPRQVVIVGAGAAGTAAAEMLRRLGFDGRVLLIDPDPDSPYDRPNLSKDYLAGNAPEEWIPLR